VSLIPVPTELIADLARPDDGLSNAEAARRLQQWGRNDIIPAPRADLRELLLETVTDPMIWFLLGVGLLFLILRNYTEAMVMALALVPLAGMDFYLHRRTRLSTSGLQQHLGTMARVRRERITLEVPTESIVPGDLLELGAGDYLPADTLVVAANELRVDESILTGESFPVAKHALALPLGEPAVAASAHCLFAGTRILTGNATARVVNTAGHTLYGQIIRSASETRHSRTRLQDAVARLVNQLLVVAALMCVALATTRLLQGHGLVDALLSAVTLAVAALPEEFPVVLTFFLGMGVYRLARRQALVRRSVAVENIGRVTCICSDKTGTLTEGNVSLAHRLPGEGITEEQLVDRAGLACRADSGDPLDRAILLAACDHPSGEAKQKRLAVFPFNENRRRETAIVDTGDGSNTAVVKGAPETIFGMLHTSPQQLAEWRSAVAELAAGGHKVIACATRKLEQGWNLAEEPSRGFTFQGLLAFEDQLRPGVRDAVNECRQAGIHIVMITGDHPVTAAAIARELGLGGVGLRVVNAETLPDSWPTEGTAEMMAVDVVARARPAQKDAIVQELQRQGETVALTGDGVNDVPALKRADIGIAMGEHGTQSARDVAAIVLLDDNFRTIVRSIAEGRALFSNLRLAFAYLLLIHIPLVASATLVPLAGHPLLYLPIHIVWLELIIHPTALLVFQQLPAEPRLAPTQRSTRPVIFTGRMWVTIALGGALLSVVIIAGYEQALASARTVEHARSMALAALVAASAAITIILGGIGNRAALLTVTASIGSLALLVECRPLASALHLQALHVSDWALAAIGGVAASAIAWLVRRGLESRPKTQPTAA